MNGPFGGQMCIRDSDKAAEKQQRRQHEKITDDIVVAAQCVAASIRLSLIHIYTAAGWPPACGNARARATPDSFSLHTCLLYTSSLFVPDFPDPAYKLGVCVQDEHSEAPALTVLQHLSTP